MMRRVYRTSKKYTYCAAGVGYLLVWGADQMKPHIPVRNTEGNVLEWTMNLSSLLVWIRSGFTFEIITVRRF